jgi:hypothetical protein
MESHIARWQTMIHIILGESYGRWVRCKFPLAWEFLQWLLMQGRTAAAVGAALHDN